MVAGRKEVVDGQEKSMAPPSMSLPMAQQKQKRRKAFLRD